MEDKIKQQKVNFLGKFLIGFGFALALVFWVSLMGLEIEMIYVVGVISALVALALSKDGDMSLVAGTLMFIFVPFVYPLLSPEIVGMAATATFFLGIDIYRLPPR